MTPEVQEWATSRRDWIEVFHLPRYAPEVNPGEYLNNDLKGRVNKAGVPRDAEEVRSRIQHFMRRLLHLPEHVMQYFRRPSVQYAAAINATPLRPCLGFACMGDIESRTTLDHTDLRHIVRMQSPKHGNTEYVANPDFAATYTM
jgi:hypothetical protein